MRVTTTNGFPDATDETKSIIMRSKRDSLLLQSDWTQFADSPLSETKRNEWKVYRQALRDFPSTWVPADTCDFPDKPEGA